MKKQIAEIAKALRTIDKNLNIIEKKVVKRAKQANPPDKTEKPAAAEKPKHKPPASSVKTDRVTPKAPRKPKRSKVTEPVVVEQPPVDQEPQAQALGQAQAHDLPPAEFQPPVEPQTITETGE